PAQLRRVRRKLFEKDLRVGAVLEESSQPARFVDDAGGACFREFGAELILKAGRAAQKKGEQIETRRLGYTPSTITPLVLPVWWRRTFHGAYSGSSKNALAASTFGN